MKLSMRRFILLLASVLLAGAIAFAQSEPQGPIKPRVPVKPSKQTPAKSQSEDEQSSGDTANGASSKESRGDTSAPLGDLQEHPDSEPGEATSEMHVWNPHKADKDVEVGDFHMKRRNYPAAESRYREALVYQNNNAPAMYGLAQALEKEKKNAEAVQFYELYLKTMPHGPQAENCKSALQRLSASATDAKH